jgi:hypothetical protein
MKEERGRYARRRIELHVGRRIELHAGTRIELHIERIIEFHIKRAMIETCVDDKKRNKEKT